MKKKRGLVIGLIFVLIICNGIITFGADAWGHYACDVKGYAHSFITKAGWGQHIGNGYVAMMGSDVEYLSNYNWKMTFGGKVYFGELCGYANEISESRTRTWWFDKVVTTLKIDNQTITAVAHK